MATPVVIPIWYGFNAPFIGGPEGVLSRQTDERLIRNDLLQLLLTSPGERIMRPDFGSPIRRYVFENMDRASLNSLKDAINQTILDNEPRVIVSDIILTPYDNGVLDIKIFGVFNIDKNNAINTVAKNSTLLIELKLPTNKLGNAQVTSRVAVTTP